VAMLEKVLAPWCGNDTLCPARLNAATLVKWFDLSQHSVALDMVDS